MPKPQKWTQSGLLWTWITVLVCGIDQVIKAWVIATIPVSAVMPIFFWLDFTHLHNKGAAFSFLSQEGGWQVLMLSLVAVGVMGFFLAWLRRVNAKNLLLGINIALILGGALGNLVDRMRFGYVTDFIAVHFGAWHFAVFNVADMAISIGAFFLVIYFLFLSKGDSRV